MITFHVKTKISYIGANKKVFRHLPLKRKIVLSLVKCTIRDIENRKLTRTRHNQIFTLYVGNGQRRFKLLSFPQGTCNYPLTKQQKKPFYINLGSKSTFSIKIQNQFRYTDFLSFMLELKFRLLKKNNC